VAAYFNSSKPPFVQADIRPSRHSSKPPFEFGPKIPRRLCGRFAKQLAHSTAFDGFARRTDLR
jgi:hypothetical protein